MNEDQALRIGRKAVEDARKRVGNDRNALLQELEKGTKKNTETMQAFAIAGRLFLQASQATKQ
ncbi:hypothetical protein CEQ23_22500 [Burkholderia cepacia]|uniref:Uncharacterized protein n=1 Tax=Burkholderia cepacia TaxID=292 RepID=A0ABN5CXS9_BURCE|nr:hypothetical protein DM41_2880 [Burkholderia cepacia ATCC 25416]ASE96093.1 hypothetical protein CEQ23_22500 [Burkholderia cepacia]ATF78905.1 hypothetical protein CO711_16760 [Burkholderia cepacia]SPU85382.1 Uncharacterised protein [Burkholderia cepacia]